MCEERLHLVGTFTRRRGPYEDLRNRKEGGNGEDFVGTIEFRGGDEHYCQCRVEGKFGGKFAEGCQIAVSPNR